MKLNPKLAFLIEYLDLPKATGIPDAQWETFQLSFLNTNNTFDITSKSRQIGWSWIAAADAVAQSILIPNSPHIFVSISQDEAKEKILYARTIMNALDKSVRPTNFPIENQTEIHLANGSRMISHPCRPPRGKGRVTIYLDEFAHYPIANEIFTAAVPVTTRGGKLRIGSTPLGAQGMFWEIYAQSIRAYPGFTRNFLPWWVALGLCVDTKTAVYEAPGMPTHERVEHFGSSRLKEIFANMPLEDFQQEYECSWIDESQSWITWDEIQRNQFLATNDELIHEEVKFVQTEDLLDLDMTIAKLKNLQVHGHIENDLVGGMDIGRTKNTTEIILLGGTKDDYFPFRLGVQLDRCEFHVQEAAVKKIIRGLGIRSFQIDQHGLGMQLSENMAKEFPDIVGGALFTAKTKQNWAIDLKLAMQRTQIPIPLNKDLSYQIHSIKKKVSASNTTLFDSSDKKHHADKFWALALALNAALDQEETSSAWGTLTI